MLENKFMAGSAHISELDPKADGMPVLMKIEKTPS